MRLLLFINALLNRGESLDSQAVERLGARLKIPPANMHRIAEPTFTHFNFVYYGGRFLFLDHAIDFFKGKSSPWDPHIHDVPQDN